jgi:hypothetical protein
MYMADTSLSTLTPLMENGAFTAFSAAELGEMLSQNRVRSVFYVGTWFVELFPLLDP